jgi:hypothetical protein
MSAFSTSCFLLAAMDGKIEQCVDGKIEQCVCTKFCVKLGKSATETLGKL